MAKFPLGKQGGPWGGPEVEESSLRMIQGEEERREQSRGPWRWVVTFDDGNLCPNNLAILMCSTRWLFTWFGKTSTDDCSHNLVKQSLKTASVASHSWHKSSTWERRWRWRYVQLFSPTTPKGSVHVLTTHLEAEASEQLSACHMEFTCHPTFWLNKLGLLLSQFKLEILNKAN